jgi:DNA-binding cell septation regulator SpoVG
MAGLAICAISGNSGLFVCQLVQDNLLGSVANVVHPLNPEQLV